MPILDADTVHGEPAVCGITVSGENTVAGEIKGRIYELIVQGVSEHPGWVRPWKELGLPVASGAQRLPSRSTWPGVAGTPSAGSLTATENRLGHSLSLFWLLQSSHSSRSCSLALNSCSISLPGGVRRVSCPPLSQGILLSIWKGKNTHQLF